MSGWTAIRDALGKALLSDGAGSLQVAAVSTPLLDPAHDGVFIGPNAASGATAYLFRNTATWTLQTIKQSGGTVYACEVSNATGSTVYAAIYDLAAPAPGTDAPKLYAIAPAGQTVIVPMGGPGADFGVAITVFVATTDNGNTGAGAGVTVSARYF